MARILSSLFITILCTCVIGCVSGYAQSETTVDGPRLIAQFHDKDNEWHKLTVEMLKFELSKDTKAWAYIRVKDDKGLLKRLQLLRKGSAFIKLDESRVTYLIGNGDAYDVKSFISLARDEDQICSECVSIKAKDFENLDKLFRLRRIAGRR